MYQVTGNPLGSNLQLLVSERDERGATEVERNLVVGSEAGKVRALLRKTIIGLASVIENFYSRTGASLVVILFRS